VWNKYKLENNVILRNRLHLPESYCIHTEEGESSWISLWTWGFDRSGYTG